MFRTDHRTGFLDNCSTREQQAEFLANTTCPICLESPKKDPVTTHCGHIFCEACLYEWLGNNEKPCPSCRALLVFDKLNGMIRPTFIRSRSEGSSSSQDGSITAIVDYIWDSDDDDDEATSPEFEASSMESCNGTWMVLGVSRLYS